LIRDIHQQGKGAVANLFGDLAGPRRIHIQHQDPGAARCKTVRADTAAASGHHGHVVVEPKIRRLNDHDVPQIVCVASMMANSR
jgi:hypothetical protein